MKVLVTDCAWPSLERERQLLAAAGAELVVAATGEEDELVELVADCDAILTNWRRVTAAVLDAAPRCRVVVRYGVGVDNIAVERATALGIAVANVPDYCVEEVAEHTMALVLALVRTLVPFADQTRAGGWDNAAFGMPRRLRGQVLGLVGCGRIGQATAQRARAFGMDVLALTRARRALPEGIAPVADLDELLARADVVSLHLPHTPQTDRLIGAPQLRRMKPTALLVNTARGALVDQAALGRALREGWIAGAGLDVLAPEPPAPDEPLLALPNALVTPHASFYSQEAIAALQEAAAHAVLDALAGRVPDTVVDRAVLDRPNLRIAAARAGR